MHNFSKRILIIGFFIAIVWTWAFGNYPSPMDDVFINLHPCGECLCAPDGSGECMDPYGDVKPSESMKDPIKSSFSSRIFDSLSEMISKWWFEPAFSYLLLVLVVFLFEIVRKERNQQTPE